MSFWGANWQWLVPLIVRVVALALAVSPALQMKYGRPQISIGQPKPRVIDDSVFWQYAIKNMPIKGKFLNILGVTRRTAEGVISPCLITNCEDSTKQYRFIPKIQDYTGNGLGQSVNIASGATVHATFLIVEQNGDVSLFDDNFTKLSAGIYRLTVGVVIEGRIYREVGTSR